MSDTAPSPTGRNMAFVGWYRANGRQPWRPLVQADSENAAFNKLLNEPPSDNIVLPAGRDPNRPVGST